MSEPTPRAFTYAFGRIYDAYLAKLDRKGRTEAELVTVLTWLTGWTEADVARLRGEESVTIADFLTSAPALHPARDLITGSVCGVKVHEVADPTMRLIRQLDKLVDELAKGRALDKVLREA